MSVDTYPPTTSNDRPDGPPPRRRRTSRAFRIYLWAPVVVALAIAIAMGATAGKGGTNATDNRGAQPTADAPITPEPANPEPTAQTEPTDSATMLPPEGSSNGPALINRIFPWWQQAREVAKYFIGAGTPELRDPTTGWVDYVNTWTHDIPQGNSDSSNPFAGQATAANGVVLRETDPLYPHEIGADGKLMFPEIDPHPPGEGDVTPESAGSRPTIRYWRATLYPSGLDGNPGEVRLFVLQWRDVNGVKFLFAKTCDLGTTVRTCHPY